MSAPHSRVPSGVPTGGQFSASAKTEAEVSLTDAPGREPVGHDAAMAAGRRLDAAQAKVDSQSPWALTAASKRRRAEAADELLAAHLAYEGTVRGFLSTGTGEAASMDPIVALREVIDTAQRVRAATDQARRHETWPLTATARRHRAEAGQALLAAHLSHVRAVARFQALTEHPEPERGHDAPRTFGA